MPATALLTSEQYLALPDEFDRNGNHVKDELIGGEVVRMPPPSLVHDLIKNKINELLLIYLLDNKELALRCFVEMGTAVSKHDTFVPDVSVVSQKRLSANDRILRGGPEIAIEVVSPADTAIQLKSKVDAYLAGGSQTVWVVYPDARSVMVHTVDSVRELKPDQDIEAALIPGFSTLVSAFFELT
jgi:Uma2 family endonuclease